MSNLFMLSDLLKLLGFAPVPEPNSRNGNGDVSVKRSTLSAGFRWTRSSSEASHRMSENKYEWDEKVKASPYRTLKSIPRVLGLQGCPYCNVLSWLP